MPAISGSESRESFFTAFIAGLSLVALILGIVGGFFENDFGEYVALAIFGDTWPSGVTLASSEVDVSSGSF